MKTLSLAVLMTAALSLTGCETVKTSLNSGYSGMKSAFSNLTSSDAPSEQVAGADQPATMGPSSMPMTPDTQAALAASLGSTADPSMPQTEPSSTSVAANGDCPEVRIVEDLKQVHQFADPMQPKPESDISAIWMTGVQHNCTLTGKNAAIDIAVNFNGKLGPKGRAHSGDKPSFAYPYFVAITNDQGNIIAKEVFAVTLAYDAGRNDETKIEQIRQMIPAEGDAYKSYKVLIGFQLTDQELAFNRALPPELLAPAANPVTMIEPAAGDVIVSPAAKD